MKGKLDSLISKNIARKGALKCMDKTILWYPKYLLDSLKMEHST